MQMIFVFSNSKRSGELDLIILVKFIEIIMIKNFVH